MSDLTIDPDDHSFEAEEERKTYRRRLFTYSTKAMTVGMPVESIYVNHHRFKSALEALDRIYQLSTKSKMPHGLMLVGDTGTGKSSLISYYKESMPPSMLFEVNTGALVVRVQERPNIGRMISTMLRLINYPFSQVSKNTVSMKKDVVIDALKQKGTRMIFLDEAHHLCHARRHSREEHDGTEITEFVRELMDACQVGVILCGTKALDGLATLDRHLHSRVSARFELCNFVEPEVYRGFLKAFATQCKSFDLSWIHAAETSKLWMAACAGNPRTTKRLVVESILVAVDAGRTSLDLPTAAAAFDRIAGKDSLASNPFREATP